jgi:hypothetical protein
MRLRSLMKADTSARNAIECDLSSRTQECFKRGVV